MAFVFNNYSKKIIMRKNTHKTGKFIKEKMWENFLAGNNSFTEEQIFILKLLEIFSMAK